MVTVVHERPEGTRRDSFLPTPMEIRGNPHLVFKRPLQGPLWFYAERRAGQSVEAFWDEDRRIGHPWKAWSSSGHRLVEAAA